MKLNNKVITVIMPWSDQIVYTPNDIVFNVVNKMTNWNPLVLLKCKNESPAGVINEDYFEPFITMAFANRATNAQNAGNDPDQLVSAAAIRDIFMQMSGVGYNSSGIHDILPDGTDFDTLQQSRYQLNKEFTYNNAPVPMSSLVFAIIDTYLISKIGSTPQYVQMVAAKSVVDDPKIPNRLTLYYRANLDGTWSKWMTYQQSDAASIFGRYYADRAAAYMQGVVEVSEYMQQLNDTTVKEVFIYEGSISEFPVINLMNFDEGYYEIHILNKTTNNQYTFTFTMEDVRYVLVSSLMRLGGYSADYQVDLIMNAPGSVRLSVNSSLNNQILLSIYRLPLKSV